MAKIRRMFPGGNTASGFYSFHDNIMGPNREKFYILKGMPGGGKSSLMKEIGRRALKEGFTVEYHHCPSDPESIDGLVIQELKVGIVDGTAPHIVDPIYPGLMDRLIDLVQYIDEDILKPSKNDIIKAKRNNKKAYGKAFTYFKTAKIIYKLIEENNRDGVDFKGINREGSLLIDEIFSEKPSGSGEFFFKERHLFSNANTPEGFIDYTDSILEGVKRVIYIEGDMGTGKAEILNRLIEEGRIRDYSLEVYHNSTIPEEVETLIIKDIDTCITSNRRGHEYAYKRINLNQYFDEKIKDDKDYQTYDLLISKGIYHLSKARENHEILEKAYRLAINYDEINRVKEELAEEIFHNIK